ncbi:MAG: alpha/beta hydrolase, partial [Leptospirales bacterium]
MSTKYDYHLCRLRLGSGPLAGGSKKSRFGELPGETRRVALPGGDIRVNLTGSGAQTVLLSPDPPHVLETYAPVIRAVAARFRVIAFESPGFGYSRPTRRYDFSLDSLAGVIEGVLDATETRRVLSAVPCGNGFGALRFAQLNPDRVAGIVSVQTPEFGEYLNWVDRVDPGGAIRAPLNGQRHVARKLQEVSRNWLRVAENDRALQAEYIEASARHLRDGACYCLASALQKFVATEDPFRD